ncbi:MAG: pseudouridine synthase [Pseudomonadota bacterium]
MNKKPIRLQKLIAQKTELSRRAAEQLISQGKVSVNGQKVTILGTKVDPEQDKIQVLGYVLRQPDKLIYLAYCKPRGEMVTKEDPQDRPTVWDNLKKWKKSLNSVGRLDFNSEGLLLLTNDGELLNILTHPKHEISKVYEVKVKGCPSTMIMEKITKGIIIDGDLIVPLSLKLIKQGDAASWLEISITQGKNRVIRRMCEKVGLEILRLRRTAHGPINLGKMRARQWRHLTSNEIKSLRGIK